MREEETEEWGAERGSTRERQMDREQAELPCLPS